MTNEQLFEYLAELGAPLEVYEKIDALIGAANPEAPPLYPEAATPAERLTAHLSAVHWALEQAVNHLDSALNLTDDPASLIPLGTYYLHLQHLRGIVTAMARDIAKHAQEDS